MQIEIPDLTAPIGSAMSDVLNSFSPIFTLVLGFAFAWSIIYIIMFMFGHTPEDTEEEE